MPTKLQATVLRKCLDKVIDYRGKTPKKLGSDWINKGYRALSANNVKGSGLTSAETIRCVDADTYKKWMKEEIRRGDILLTSEAPAGEVMVWDSDEKIVLSQRLFGLRTNSHFDNRFIKYYLQGPTGKREVNRTRSGSTVAGISAEMFDQIQVLHPELRSQKKIAGVLFEIDAKIDLNNRINSELEALAKTIYDYWFVQFDFPTANGRPYKTSGGKMVWNDTLKREIPAGWDTTSIGNACNTILGGTPDTKNPEYWDNADIPWLSSGETSCFPVVGSEQLITSAGIRDSAARLLPAGTVIVSIVRYIRPSILAIPAATNQSVVGILQTDLLPSSYLYPVICREVPRWMALRTGAQQPHINKATVDETLILKPAKTAVSAYREIADPIFKRINVAANENRELTQLRDWLLPLLMNGQVRVA